MTPEQSTESTIEALTSPTHLRWRSLYSLLPLLVLIIFLLITWYLWLAATTSSKQTQQEYFDFRVREAVSHIEERMQAYEQVLHGVKGLFESSDDITRDKFRSYVTSLQLAANYPGIQGVGFSLIVPAANKSKHIAAVRKQGFPKYSISPEGQRDLYTSIIYLEPFSGLNLRAFGYDMYSESVRRAAMDRARDSGNAAMSGKVKLVQEAGRQTQAGFLLYLPIYKNGEPVNTLEERRANIIGWAYAPFRMHDLIAGTLGEQSSDLDLEIYDGEQITDSTLMYDSNSDETHSPHQLNTTRTLSIAGHKLTVKVSGLPGIYNRIDNERAQVIAVEGVAVSLMLALLTWLLVSGRERAVMLAQEMNKELIEAEARFRLQSKHLAEIIWGTNIGTWEWNIMTGETVFNERWAQIIGYTLDELAPISIDTWVKFVHPDDNKRSEEMLERCFRHEIENYECELRMRHKNGDWIWVLDRGRVVEWTAEGKPLRMSGTHQDITKRKKSDEALRTLYTAVEQSPISIVITNLDANIEYVNPKFTEVTGYSAEEVMEKNPRILQAGLTPKGTYSDLWGKLTHDEPWNGELVNKRKNGDIYWEDAHIAPVKNESGIRTHYVAAKVDITQRKLNEKAIHDSEERFRFILENSPIAVRIAKLSTGAVVFVNQRYAELLGIERDEMLEIKPRDYYANPQDYDEILKQVVENRSVMNRLIELKVSHDGEKTAWVLASYLPIQYKDEPSVLGWFYDISEQKATADHVEFLANYDTLTRLPNRRLLTDRLEQALTAAKRDKTRLACVFIDLDKFKPVNDTYGHDIGDLLLNEVAVRIQGCLRESDTVARIGGDEFVVLLPKVDADKDALVVAEKIRSSLKQTFLIDGRELHIGLCAGVSIYPDHGDKPNLLMKHADVAMYNAKAAGRDNVKLYQPDMQEKGI